jgi:hypothetical protein
MKLIFIALFILPVLQSCSSFNMMNGADPKKQSFKYYDTKFKLDSAAKLTTDKKYVLVEKSGVDILVFFKDGFLNNHATVDVNAVGARRVESGVIMGYYKLQGDSIFFTTKSYYQHKPTYYRGLIRNDTLDLEVKYPTKKTTVKETYVLFK